MKILLIALLLILITSSSLKAVDTQWNKEIVYDHVDIMEINHFYDFTGKLIFDQIIYYNWSKQNARYDVVDWKLLEGVRKPYTEEEAIIETERLRLEWRKDNPSVDITVPAIVPRWIGGNNRIPTKQPNGKYACIFNRDGYIYKMTCDMVIETWDTDDIELSARSLLPKERRRGLVPPFIRIPVLDK